MALLVLKFGGTSVGSLKRIRLVAKKVKRFHGLGNKVVVVVSAMGGETSRLMSLAEDISQCPDPRELDMLLATGEQVAVALLSMALREIDCMVASYTGAQLDILTDNNYNRARILSIDCLKIRNILRKNKILVVTGFQGVNEHGDITTLGRGGSDTTAVALAAALKADACHIYTDVEGVFTTDPNLVSNARCLETITFEEMLEMASQGSKVLQARAVELAGKYNINLWVYHAFKEGRGTLITNEGREKMEAPVVSGIAFDRDEAKVTVRSVPHIPGVAMRILQPISDANIDVDTIVQNIGLDKRADFTFTVHRCNYEQTMLLIKSNLSNFQGSECEGDSSIAKVSIVGAGMRSHPGIATRMFQALAKEGINIEVISTSDIKVTVVIAAKYLELAVRTLHCEFNLDKGN